MNKNIYNIKNRGAILLVLCVLFISMFMLGGCEKSKPDPEFVKVVNPLMEVSSLEEMEEYLDFSVPVLENEVEAYIVLVIDGYPTQARIRYQDGMNFDMKHGSGDVSGIYGGKLVKEETLGETKVSFMCYEDINYAIWEKNGFTYSLSGNGDLAEYVSELIK